MATNYWPVNTSFPNPSYYRHIIWHNYTGGAAPDASTRADGIHYPGDSVNISFDPVGGTSAATSYTVFDWYGNVVSAGSITPPVSVVTLTPPTGGWTLGWYRVYFAGPSTDTTWGDTYASTCFAFVRDSSRFRAMPPASSILVGGSGQNNDFVRKGTLGFGTSRMLINDAANPNTGGGSGGDFIGDLTNDCNNYAVPYWTGAGVYQDPVRPRHLWCAFPNGTADAVSITYSGGEWGRAMPKDGTVDGTKVYVSGGAGSSSGSKIQVYYPNNSTLVETYDNVASVTAAMAAINGVSSYITVWGDFNISTQAITGPSTPTVCGNAKYNGVVLTVQSLFPLGVTHYEGPANEPTLTNTSYVGIMRRFRDAVHQGNAAAVAIGPCPVDINYPLSTGTGWKTFLDNGGGNDVDEFSFHAYNSSAGGDLNLARKQFTHFTGFLGKYGQSTKAKWQTESTWVNVTNYGLLQPRSAAWEMVAILLQEQFGIPREKNNHWYDTSHGFWSVPAWWELSGSAAGPQAILARVLADETWGLNHRQKITFGELADNIFLGSVYGDPGTANVAVVMTGSYLPNASVTFKVTGPPVTSLTYSDPWGTTSTLNISSGLVTMPVQDIPCYLRLPAGNRIQVDHVNDWPTTTMKNLSGLATTYTMNNGATSAPELCDGRHLWSYEQYTAALAAGGQRTSGATVIPGTATDTATLLFPSTISTDRVIVWAGNVWQKASTLLDFDVQTSDNGGSTWTTRLTINNSANADNNTYRHGSAQRDIGGRSETWWNMQRVFDVNLGGTVSCNGVRLFVRRTSLGGAPNQEGSDACAFWGSADTAQHVTLQEVAVVDAAHAQPPQNVHVFNGTTDQINFGPRNEHLVSMNNKFTVGGWCCPTAVNKRQVVASGGISSDKWEIGVWSTGVPYFGKSTQSGGAFNQMGAAAMTANVWQYVAAVVDITGGTVRIYRVLEDGTFQATTVSDSHAMAYGSPIIGAGPSSSNPFAGRVTQVAVWPDVVLNDSQIVYAAVHGANNLSVVPLFYAPLQDGNTIKSDLSSFGMTGVVTGTTLFASLPAAGAANMRQVGALTI